MNFVTCFLLTCGVCARSIRVTIMYEKESSRDTPVYYKAQIGELVDRYNRFLVPENMRIELVDVLSFSDYVNVDRFAELASLAGTDSLDKRVEELEKVSDWHYILGASTLIEEPVVRYRVVAPCRGIYVFNLNSRVTVDKDLPINLSKATVELLSRVFSIEFPDFSDRSYKSLAQAFVERLKKSEVLQSMPACSWDNKYAPPKLGIMDDSGVQESTHRGADVAREVKRILDVYDMLYNDEDVRDGSSSVSDASSTAHSPNEVPGGGRAKEKGAARRTRGTRKDTLHSPEGANKKNGAAGILGYSDDGSAYADLARSNTEILAEIAKLSSVVQKQHATERSPDFLVPPLHADLMGRSPRRPFNRARAARNGGGPGRLGLQVTGAGGDARKDERVDYAMLSRGKRRF